MDVAVEQLFPGVDSPSSGDFGIALAEIALISIEQLFPGQFSESALALAITKAPHCRSILVIVCRTSVTVLHTHLQGVNV